MGLVKVYLKGSATSVCTVAPTLLLGIENGNETMKTAVPTTVAARLTGLTRRISIVASSARSSPKAGIEVMIIQIAISIVTVSFFMEVPL
jgi:hypothetical protein